MTKAGRNDNKPTEKDITAVTALPVSVKLIGTAGVVVDTYAMVSAKATIKY